MIPYAPVWLSVCVFVFILTQIPLLARGVFSNATEYEAEERFDIITTFYKTYDPSKSPSQIEALVKKADCTLRCVCVCVCVFVFCCWGGETGGARDGEGGREKEREGERDCARAALDILTESPAVGLMAHSGEIPEAMSRTLCEVYALLLPLRPLAPYQHGVR